MNFCKCRAPINLAVAGACLACGLALGPPASQAQSHSGGAAASIISVTPGHPLFSPGRYQPGSSWDYGDSPDFPEPIPTFDGPKPNYSATAATTRVVTPGWRDRLLDADRDR
jgi:hypothetical protein